jgi:hypothetical protein
MNLSAHARFLERESALEVTSDAPVCILFP